jgi:ATP-dependent DNA helicase RecG
MKQKIAWAIAPDTPIQFLRSVGEGRAGLFAAAGLHTVEDLFYFFPFRYEDRRFPVAIRDLGKIDAPVTLRGRIISAATKVSPVRRLKIFEAILDDGTGTIMLVWFNQPYLAEQIHRNDQLAVYGQPRVNSYRRLQIESPNFEKLDVQAEGEEEGSIVPVYSAVSGIPPKVVRRIVNQALEGVAALVDPMSDDLRRRLDVPPLGESIIQIHRPLQLDEAFLALRSRAHRRLILQEFFAFQLALRVRRSAEESTSKPRSIRIDDAVRGAVRSVLPFRLTTAQKRVLKEIADDLQGSRPMYRLLQGDVGSGKTIVALIAAIVVIENGHQAALLAPTEILAEQHYRRISQLVDQPAGHLRLELLTGSTPAPARKRILAALGRGEVDLVVGTHALLEDRVVFHSLALAIVDEQHRFGVEQRQKLFRKGELPDILVMTATPIPRSLALTLYGDLELSVIDELPPGRVAIKTAVRGAGQLTRVFRFMDQRIAAGERAYVVYPIIEESEKLDLTPLTIGVEEVREHLPGRRVGMLHGRMPWDEKDRVMTAFKEGRLDVLVSTTVIEVGIDVPAATVMVIMDSDRFGLSQLHQLRGRVGRGVAKSYCVLVRNEKVSEESKERLRAFEATRDGFEVSQRDLELRGAGDFLGTRQSGMPRFRFGNILRDHDLMELARDTAIGIMKQDGLPEATALAARLMGGRAVEGMGKD